MALTRGAKGSGPFLAGYGNILCAFLSPSRAIPTTAFFLCFRNSSVCCLVSFFTFGVLYDGQNWTYMQKCQNDYNPSTQESSTHRLMLSLENRIEFSTTVVTPSVTLVHVILFLRTSHSDKKNAVSPSRQQSWFLGRLPRQSNLC